MSHARKFVVLAVLVWASSLSAQDAEGVVPGRPKQVVAPAADITSGVVQLPEPAAAATSSRTALLPVVFRFDASGNGTAELEVPVAGAGELTLVPLALEADRWSVQVAPPGEAASSLGALVGEGRARRRAGTLGASLGHAGATRYDIDAARAGTWRVVISFSRAEQALGRSVRDGHGYLLVAGPGAARLVSHLTDHRLVNDRAIGLVTRLADGRGAMLTEVSLRARTPLGVLDLPMLDDGAHADGEAGDGLFGALLPHLPAGDVALSVVARGESDGGAFVRTTQHAFPVIERASLLTGRVTSEILDQHRVALDVETWLFGDVDKLHVSAEVWGAGPDGTPRPVAWLSTMATPDESGDAPSLRLQFDTRLLALESAVPPLELRQVRVQDPHTAIPYDVLERVPLGVIDLPPGAATAAVGDPLAPGGTPLGPGAFASHGPAATPTGETDTTRRDIATLPLPDDPEPLQGALMLVHGYCSSRNIWPDQDFSEPKLNFADPDQNRSHDEFALLIAALGAQVDSFGVVGHSQGGDAALHLLTYYESGLDLAVGARRIQALATPWLGSPLASSLAGLGGIFGVGCGSNFDLSSDGAALWLSGIPSAERAEVSFWTTQNSGSACNFFSNLFLDSPNDGVVERSKGQLPGGNNMGHVSGWCHTTGMSNAANYTDTTRNLEMDATAAR